MVQLDLASKLLDNILSLFKEQVILNSFMHFPHSLSELYALYRFCVPLANLQLFPPASRLTVMLVGWDDKRIKSDGNE